MCSLSLSLCVSFSFALTQSHDFQFQCLAHSHKHPCLCASLTHSQLFPKLFLVLRAFLSHVTDVLGVHSFSIPKPAGDVLMYINEPAKIMQFHGSFENTFSSFSLSAGDAKNYHQQCDVFNGILGIAEHRHLKQKHLDTAKIRLSISISLARFLRFSKNVCSCSFAKIYSRFSSSEVLRQYINRLISGNFWNKILFLLRMIVNEKFMRKLFFGDIIQKTFSNSLSSHKN